jgi:uncharacterized damage-inducible protein DinB
VIGTLDKESSLYAFCCQQLNHMVIVEELFKSRLLEQYASHKETNTSIVPNFEELEQRLISSNSWYLKQIKSTAIDGLSNDVNFVFADGQQGSMTIYEIFFHISNHATYHRSAIGHRIEYEGFVRPADTYSLYIHVAEPERRIKS